MVARLQPLYQRIEQLLRFVHLGFGPASGYIDSHDVGMSRVGRFASHSAVATDRDERGRKYDKCRLHDPLDFDGCTPVGIAEAAARAYPAPASLSSSSS